MKRILLTLMTLVVLCACNDKVCKINGTLTDPVDTVRLIDRSGTILDVAAVKDGVFTLKCEINPDTEVALFRGEDAEPVTLIPDVKNITVTFADGAPVVTGSPMSQELLELQQWTMTNYFDYMNRMMAAMEVGDTLSIAATETEMKEVMGGHLREAYQNHKADPIGHQAFSLLMNFITPEEFVELYEQAGKAIQEDATIGVYYEYLTTTPKTGVTTLLDNGEVITEEGVFEDFVGAGKYTLVDFWASWCGPCRQETPNVVAIYEKYHDKGLVVIGIPVNDKQDAMVQALKDLGIHYPQLLDPMMTQADRFRVEGIPYIILFDPEGNIVAKDLRGAQIEAAVSKVL